MSSLLILQQTLAADSKSSKLDHDNKQAMLLVKHSESLEATKVCIFVQVIKEV